MRRSLSLVPLAILLAATMFPPRAVAQTGNGWIGVYSDMGASSCQIQDIAGEVTVEIFHMGAIEANTSRFRLVKNPGVQMTYLQSELEPGMLSLGDVRYGITITYGRCRTSFPLHLMTVTYYGTGSTVACVPIMVEGDPASASGDIQVVDCSGILHTGIPSTWAWVNSNGDCQCGSGVPVTVDTDPTGLQVVVDGTQYTAPRTIYSVAGTSHGIGVPSPQDLGAGTFVFDSWSDGGAQTHTIVTPSEPLTVTAAFEPYTAPRVRIESDPSGLTVEVDGQPYVTPQYFTWTEGTQHDISAVSPQGPPDSTYVFSSWSDGGAQIHTITAPGADTTFTAAFELGPRYTVETSPPGLTIQADGLSYTSPKALFWVEGSSHELGVPSPQGPADSMYVFSSWSDGGAQTHTVMVPGVETTVTATLDLAPRFTIDTTPPGFVISVDGAYYNAPHDFFWTGGTTRDLDAVSPQGPLDSMYVFSSWSDGGEKAHTVTAPGTELTLSATFDLAPRFTIDTAPTGLTVIADGESFAAPKDLFWAQGSSHDIGVVTPQGAPPDVYVFSSWSDGGDLTHVVVAPGVEETVTATFEPGVPFRVDSQPSGLQVVVDAQVYDTPNDFYWVDGSNHHVLAPEFQQADTAYVFESWSDGGAREHDVVAPGVVDTLTAHYIPTADPETADAVIGVYTDDHARYCDLFETQGIVSLRIFHTGTQSANTSRFRIVESPGLTMAYISETTEIGLSLGQVRTGITITYGSCIPSTQFPLHLMTVNYLMAGDSPACSYIEVVGDPATASGEIEVITCDYNTLQGLGRRLMVNPDETCACNALLPTRATTWGDIKALFEKK